MIAGHDPILRKGEVVLLLPVKHILIYLDMSLPLLRLFLQCIKSPRPHTPSVFFCRSLNYLLKIVIASKETIFMIHLREGHWVIFYKIIYFYLDYLEQIIKFYFCGGTDPICLHNCVQRSSDRGPCGGGSERTGRPGNYRERGRASCQINLKTMVMKINTL